MDIWSGHGELPTRRRGSGCARASEARRAPRVHRALCAAVALVVGIVAGPPASADFTTVKPSEQLVLDAPGGVLDQLYGLSNLERIHDFNAPQDDQSWVNLGQGQATAMARFAGLEHQFGIIPGESGSTGFVFLLFANQSGFLNDPPVPFDIQDTGPIFRLGLNALSGSSDPDNFWSSRTADNPDATDHVVSYRIVGSDAAHPDNAIGNYVVCWEDLPSPPPSDPNEPDYNDLVIELEFLAPEVCGDGVVGGAEECDTAGDPSSCCTASCQLVAAGTECRAAAGACDVPETCNGVDAVCPADGFAADGTDCGDGDVCNGVESCQAGACISGTAPDCDDGNVCTVDSCSPTLGCQNGPVTDGSSCADTDLCNGAETCQGGFCIPGVPPDCGDGNACTTDSCDPGTGCQNVALPDNTSCEDVDACNGVEFCQGGVCLPGPAPDCDDGNACTAGSCDPALGCQYQPVMDGLPCVDGLACNGAESCQGGVCMPGTPPPDGTSCSNGNSCDGDETCQGGSCIGGTPPAEGSNCDDGDVCNGVNFCSGGQCMSSQNPLDCDDRKPCTADSCDQLAGCSHTLIPDCGNPTEPVVPELDCVTDNPDGTVTAHFGYRNDNQVPITIPIGADNSFSPAPDDAGQPTLFNLDRHPFYPNSAVSVSFDGQPLTWTLRGPDGVARSSTASADSLRCPPEGSGFSEATICYRTRRGGGQPKAPKLSGVEIADSVEQKLFDIKGVRTACVPAETIIDGVRNVITDPDTWQLSRKIRQTKGTQPAFSPVRNLEYSNLFGSWKIDLTRADSLSFPAAKCNPEIETCPATAGEVEMNGVGSSAHKCYKVKRAAGEPKPEKIALVGTDEFQTRVYNVSDPKLFCAPSSLDGNDPGAPLLENGQLCHKLRLRVLYCEAGSPPEHSLEHCRPLTGACGEGRCVIVPKRFLHRWRAGLQANNFLFPEVFGTVREKLLCVPATRENGS